MKINLKNKIFIVFVFLFFIILFLNNYSNASTQKYSFEDYYYEYVTIYYTVPTNCKSYVLFKDAGYFVMLYTDVNNAYWGITSNGRLTCYTDSSCSTVANFYRTKASDSQWNYTPTIQDDGTYLLDFANANFMTFTTFSNCNTFCASNVNVYYTTGELYKESTENNFPSFITSKDELESGNFETLKIDAGDLDYSDASGRFLLNIYLGTYIDDNIYNYSIQKTILLEYSSSYLYQNNLDLYYYIPCDKLGIDLSNGKRYMFELKEKGGDTVYSSVEFTVTGLTLEDEKNNYDDLTHQKMDEQTAAIKESNETNKGIWGTLKEVLSFINPFSENFFVYKLLELLSDLLKSLFVPSSEFMSQWFTDISDYFEDAFGILYYPVDLVIQVLGKFGDIAEEEPVISFGNLSLFGVVLIPAYSYNFNDLLINDTLQMIHNFYLITIDVILWLGLLVYCKNVCANIFGGKFTDDVIHEVQDPGGYGRTEARVSRYNSVKQKLNGQKKG